MNFIWKCEWVNRTLNIFNFSTFPNNKNKEMRSKTATNQMGWGKNNRRHREWTIRMYKMEMCVICIQIRCKRRRIHSTHTVWEASDTLKIKNKNKAHSHELCKFLPHTHSMNQKSMNKITFPPFHHTLHMASVFHRVHCIVRCLHPTYHTLKQ